MFMKDKNKSVSAIIARMKPNSENMKSQLPSAEDQVQDESPEVSEVDTAAEEILSAIESKDANALKEALQAFMDLCKQE